MRRLTVIFWHMLTKQQPYTTAAAATRRAKSHLTQSRRVAQSVAEKN